jgi:hypothetical protein
VSSSTVAPQAIERLAIAARQLALPAWFILVIAANIPRGLLYWAVDATLYRQATLAWLAGGDPWSVSANGTPFAAPPPSLLFYLPFAMLPEALAVGLHMLLGLVVSILVLRRLGLPLWWLLFPPLFQGIFNGNTQPILLGLLLLDRPWATALAVVGKSYAVLPAIVARKWRHLLVTAVVLLVTVPVLPWGPYLARGTSLGDILTHNWNGSAWADPALLLIPTMVAIFVLRNREGPWLSVSGLWLGTQLSYSLFALPGISTAWLAAALAVPIAGVPSVAIIGLALSRSGIPAVPVQRLEPAAGHGRF